MAFFLQALLEEIEKTSRLEGEDSVLPPKCWSVPTLTFTKWSGPLQQNPSSLSAPLVIFKQKCHPAGIYVLLIPSEVWLSLEWLLFAPFQSKSIKCWSQKEKKKKKKEQSKSKWGLCKLKVKSNCSSKYCEHKCWTGLRHLERPRLLCKIMAMVRTVAHPTELKDFIREL